MNTNPNIDPAIHERFSPGEMVALVCATSSRELDKDNLVGVFDMGIADQRDLLRVFGRVVNFSLGRCMDKLASLAPEACADLAERLKAVHSVPMHTLYPGALPSRHVLAAHGLQPQEGPAAWGFAVVATPRRVHEHVIWHDPATGDLAERNLEALAEDCVAIVAGGSDDADVLMRLETNLRTIAHRKRWRHVRVSQGQEGRCTLDAIKPECMLADLHDRSLASLVLEGINAPLPGGGVLF